MSALLRRVSAIIYAHQQSFRTKLQTEDSHIQRPEHVAVEQTLNYSRIIVMTV